MNEQTVYWVYIQQALGFSSSKLKNVLKSYRYADDFFYASVEEKLTADRFTDTESKNIRKASLEKAQEIIEQCKLGGIDIVSYGDDAYPDILRRISDPPAVLYVQGDVSVFKQHLHIAVVGTRSATYWGKKSAYDISYQLSNGGACVVSGGAMGIDSQAHLGAVEGAGKTICVLGCGHNSGYLKFNVSLKNRISQNGAVISEFPPSASPSKYTFPMRNRIISGLSEGTLVIEAGEGSGSLITARYAFEQNREVYSYTGGIGTAVSLGNIRVIGEGAVRVQTAQDILERYSWTKPDHSEDQELPNAEMYEEYLDIQNDELGVPSIEPVSREIRFESDALNVTDEELDEIEKVGDYSDYLMSLKSCATDRGFWSEELDSNFNAKTTDVKKRKKSADEDDELKFDFDFHGSTSDKLPVPKKRDVSKKRLITQQELDRLSQDEAEFLKILDGGQLHIDDIIEKTNLSVGAVHAAATLLEMNDMVMLTEGRMYVSLVEMPK